MEETPEELTEDERIQYEQGLITWQKAKSPRFWIRKEWIWYYVVLVIIIVVVALMAFFHHKVSRDSFFRVETDPLSFDRSSIGSHPLSTSFEI